MFLVVSPKIPAGTAAEFVEHARAIARRAPPVPTRASR